MGIVNYLQRHLKALNRVLVESSLDIKEIGAAEDSDQPELIYKKSDSSGYFHIPTLQWLNSYIAGKGGAREIGVESNSFQVLSGDTDVQNVIKQIDNSLKELSDYVDQPYEYDDYSFTCNEPALNPTVFRFHKNGNFAYCKFPLTNIEITVTTFVRFDAPAGWISKYAPANFSSFVVEGLETVGDTNILLSLGIRQTYVILRKHDGFLSIGNMLQFSRGAPVISHIIGA